MKAILYINLPEYPSILYGESSNYFAVNLNCTDLPIGDIPSRQRPNSAESGKNLVYQLKKIVFEGEEFAMKPVIYFDGAEIPSVLINETPQAFFINSVYPGLCISDIPAADLPLKANDPEALVSVLFSLHGKSIPENIRLGKEPDPDVSECFKLARSSIDNADQLLFVLEDMAAGISSIGDVSQEMSGVDSEKTLKSILRLIQHVSSDMTRRLDAATNYVEAAGISLAKLEQLG